MSVLIEFALKVNRKKPTQFTVHSSMSLYVTLSKQHWPMHIRNTPIKIDTESIGLGASLSCHMTYCTYAEFADH